MANQMPVPIPVTRDYEDKEAMDHIERFEAALYHAACGTCGEGLAWEASFDADGTTYSAQCCGWEYYMAPHTVTLSREWVGEDDDEEDEDDDDGE